MKVEIAKRCSKCGVEKPLADFRKRKASKDGLTATCRECLKQDHRVYSRTYNERHPERVRENTRKWREANPGRYRELAKGYRERHPEKVAERVRRWRKANPERVAEHKEKFAERHPKRKSEYARRQYHRHIEKARARSRLTSAVHLGKIVKPDVCEDCGEPTEKDCLHGHHEDYSHPFDVEWLCHGCHEGRHY